ncbi:uncharacterized protein LOC131047464 isoform X2 [Cryptomeria japonica]|uniref:uncharacterized protein LOC131047464 isoform X2 n=1 Tax=Cryptomeria japonica TaxID=3369 RepID=UPI0027DA70E9|nr:uncharacterized protein LOC131047464 isoform X2 [Cryptomeria japonica]
MAMLLLRSGGLSGLAGTQKVPLSSLTYTREGSISGNMIQEENSQHPHQQRSSRSSRKSKNGQKKIPQRGLGVAQLEKLRLEEQQKQEAACLASLQRAHALPPFTSALHSQAALHPQGNSLVFTHNCASQIKGRPLEQHQPFMSPTNNCKMSDSIISMVNLHSINYRQQMGLGSSNSSPQQQSPREENRALTRNRSSDPESSVTNVGVASSGFVSGSWPAQTGNGEDMNRYLNQEMDTRKANMFSLRFQNSSSPPNEFRFFEPFLRSPAPSRKLPVVSISSSGATMQLEPPSNQSYSTTPSYNEEDRIAGIKRPWPFSQENPTCPVQSKATCLNVGIGIHQKFENIGNSNIDRLEAIKHESPGIFRNSLGISLGSLKKKTAWQANSELASPGDQPHSEISFSCDSGSTPKIETPDGSFLTLGLPHPTDGDCRGNELYCKPIQHFSTSETSDECGLPNNPSIHLNQEISGGLSTTAVFPSNGLLKHCSIKSADFRHQEDQSVPFYKFLHTLSDQGTADFICLDKKVSNRDPKESVDLKLRLSL